MQSKWLLIAFFYTVIIWRHDAKALWLVLGANLNGGLSVTLKKILKQERPSSAFKSDHGMPSTHAQSIFYIVFVANLSSNYLPPLSEKSYYRKSLSYTI